MPLDWYQTSRRNMGLILNGKKHPSAYSSEQFADPFDEVHEFMCENPEWTKEDLYQRFSASELDAAKHDAASLNGSSELDWPATLRRTKNLYELGENLEYTGHKLKQGEEPELLPLVSELRSVSTNEHSGLQLSKDIDWQSAKGLQKSGWDVLDNTIGGIAESGPVVVYGTTKTGKSFFTAKLINEFLHYYPEKKAAIFPLELTSSRYLKRSFEMYPTLLEIHEEGRLYVTSKTRKVEGIISDVSTLDGIGIIVIDGIDGLVQGQFETSKFAGTWAQIIEMGVVLDVPVVVTAQPNRDGKWRAEKEFLSRYSIEWSGAAENGCEQLLALQYIRDELDFEDEMFPKFSDAYYIISWLQREGWQAAQEGPGAIILRECNGKLWEGPAYKNTLWRPGAAKAKIGKGKSRVKKDDF